MAVDQLHVRQHPGLPVDCEVVRAADELREVDTRPVLSLVAGLQDLRPAPASAVQPRRPPCRPTRHVSPLTQVTADGGPEERDVEISPVSEVSLS